MKIFRVVDADGRAVWASSANGTDFTRLAGTFPDFAPTEEPLEVSRLLAPVERPPAIWCVGLNFHEHAKETGQAVPEYPILFLKTAGCIIGPGDVIELPRGLKSNKVDYEVELTVVIGKGGKNIPAERAAMHILGFTIANDVSARDWQKVAGGGQWVRGKAFDTSCPLGPCIATPDELEPLDQRCLRSWINGELRQHSTPADMMFSVYELVAFVSRSTTLEPGTLILTGTPHGVGFAMNPRQFLKLGDQIRMEIDGIGVLENPVGEESLDEGCSKKAP